MGIADILNPYRTVESARDAKDLAKLLIDPQREKPVAVVSTTKAGTFINPTALAKKLGPDVDVYLLESARVAYDFQDAMPFDTAVYGGAARCYPSGTAWMKNSSLAMVRLAYTDAEGKAAINLLADDVAAATSYPPEASVSSSPKKAADKVHAEGIVSVILEPDGVLVQLDEGIARIDTSVMAPGISPALLFSHSQKVSGIVRHGILTLDEGFNTPTDAADHAIEGAILPALVTSPKTVALFPGLTIRHTSEAPEGSVIAVRVDLSGRADGKAWKLATVTDPDDVAEALPFMKDGQPWITWQRAEPEPDTAEDLGPTPSTRAYSDPFAALDAVHDHIENLTADNARLTRELEALKATPAEEAIPLPSPAFAGIEVARLRAEVASQARQITELTEGRHRAMADADDLGAEVTLLSHTVERLRADVRTERDRADRARQAARETDIVLQSGPAFLDPEDQFRHEVYLEWATRIPAASKGELPLADYALGEAFLETVEAIQGIDRSKIIAVAVEVLTGLADEMPGRDMHRLRGGLPGTSGIEHPELGTAWRVALQINTASARRMHFWRGTDGRIVFATVGVHDDMDI